jgi:two-component system, sensor histidine kinase and response regulator
MLVLMTGRKQMRVLIADDDPVITQTVRTGLRARGWEVDVAADAMQAVMFAVRSVPDAVILDIQMPGGTGLMALERLRSSLKTRFVPVLVLSGSTDPAQLAGVKEKADRFLPKPVDLDALEAALRELVGDKERSGP